MDSRKSSNNGSDAEMEEVEDHGSTTIPATPIQPSQSRFLFSTRNRCLLSCFFSTPSSTPGSRLPISLKDLPDSAEGVPTVPEPSFGGYTPRCSRLNLSVVEDFLLNHSRDEVMMELASMPIPPATANVFTMLLTLSTRPMTASEAKGMSVNLPLLRFVEGAKALEKSIAFSGQPFVPRTMLATVNAGAELLDEDFDYGGDAMLCLTPATVNEELLLCSPHAISALQCLNSDPERPGMLDRYLMSVCLTRSRPGTDSSKLQTETEPKMPVCTTLSPVNTGLAHQLWGLCKAAWNILKCQCSLNDAKFAVHGLSLPNIEIKIDALKKFSADEHERFMVDIRKLANKHLISQKNLSVS